jgi:hypothetical protein
MSGVDVDDEGRIDVADEGGIDVDDRDCEGATLVCIDVAYAGGQRVPCALCVQDHTNDVSSVRVSAAFHDIRLPPFHSDLPGFAPQSFLCLIQWTCPMETRELQETRANCASRAADEELHVALPAETLADTSRFSLTSERYTAYWDSKERVNAVFISRGATAEVAGYTSDEFARRLAACEAEGKPYDFLECRALARVPLAQLLLARPGAATVCDVDGAAVQLRRGLVNVLQHLGVRVRLLEEIEAARVAEPAMAAAAATLSDRLVVRAAAAGAAAQIPAGVATEVPADVAAEFAASCADVGAPHVSAVTVAEGL